MAEGAKNILNSAPSMVIWSSVRSIESGFVKEIVAFNGCPTFPRSDSN